MSINARKGRMRTTRRAISAFFILQAGRFSVRSRKYKKVPTLLQVLSLAPLVFDAVEALPVNAHHAAHGNKGVGIDFFNQAKNNLRFAFTSSDHQYFNILA